MFRYNLLLLLRNFKRDKTSFLINLVGLSTGLACAFLIYLWVNDEMNVDKFHKNDKRLYQVMAHHQMKDGITTIEATSGLLAEALASDIPEIENAARSSDWTMPFSLSCGDKRVKAIGQCVDNDYFKIFSFGIVNGDKDNMFYDKNSIVISESVAMNLFNATENVVGKTIKWQLFEFSNEAVISGIIKDIQSNSSDQFEMAITFNFFEEEMMGYANWDNFYARTYLLLNNQAKLTGVNEKIADFVKDIPGCDYVTLFLKPFSEKYLYGNYENGILKGGKIIYIRLFSLIALFILIIACINYMNLATAKATRRIKEIGIKKVVGTRRQTLIAQYLGESLLVAFLSLFLAILLVMIFLPQFNAITGKQLALTFEMQFIATILIVVIFTGIISGSYPALYLSGFRPATILKGEINKMSEGKLSALGEIFTRKGLVVFQFTLSVVLIIAVIIVYKQIEYVQTKNLGYDRDNIVYLEQEGNITEKREVFIEELKKQPGVSKVSCSNYDIDLPGYTYGVSWEGKDPDKMVAFKEIRVGDDFVELLDIPLKDGRTFSNEYETESDKIIFNESAIKEMGIEDPIGKVIRHYSGNKEIIGIVKDFNHASLYEKVCPMHFLCDPENTHLINIKIKAGQEQVAISNIEKVFKKFNPGYTFNFEFLDDKYHSLYLSEIKIGKLYKYFAGMTILISCLGLFGLSAYMVERRTKEFGIRKSMGSGSVDIVYLLTLGYTKVVFVAILISIPLSYLLAKRWLNNFAYHIEINPWYFLLAGFFVLITAWLVVGMHAIRAANINPARCLKEE